MKLNLSVQVIFAMVMMISRMIQCLLHHHSTIPLLRMSSWSVMEDKLIASDAIYHVIVASILHGPMGE